MLSIIIPTYNEAANIPELLSSIDRILYEAGRDDYEVLVMDDDSPDGTAALVGDLALNRVRAVNRKGKPRGLAHAVIDGIRESRGDVVLVMDADLSHPPKLIPELWKAVERGSSIAVGSRYVPAGGCDNWPWFRYWGSRLACLLAGVVTPVTDATSGFFAVRKSALDGVTLNPLGFKVGLEIFVKSRHQGDIIEIPYRFRDRRAGKSKLTGSTMTAYLKHLWLLLRWKLEGRR